MSKDKPTLLDDLLESVRDWRNMTPRVLVLPGTILIFIGAAAFLLMRALEAKEIPLGVQIVLWIVELGLVVLGWALAIYGFAAERWPWQARRV